MERRAFLGMVGAGAAGLLLPARVRGDASAPADRPNILWITCEDMGPHLGCYGDCYAHTPNLDRFAAQGMRYESAFALFPVCAPSRSCLITGMYSSSIGSHNMRSRITLPDHARTFTAHLRDAGYYCTNNSKTDYNFAVPDDAWDENSRRAHWRRRDNGQPFFSVFNFTATHESRIRMEEEKHAALVAALPPDAVHDPADAPVPPYHPDTPEFRKDWARYYDTISEMDSMAGTLLRELEEDGLAEDTIVFFFSDHGAGMPRNKRWLWDSGLHVPLIVRVPEKWRNLAAAAPGTSTGRLVNFVDFAPSVLSLAGVPAPGNMQGRPFLGPEAAAPRDAVHGTRDRMDERIDCMRSVRTARHLYIRNFMPHRPYAQQLAYMNLMPSIQAWRALDAEGKLSGAPALFMRRRKPVEELYDVAVDPHQVNNLAGDPALADVLHDMRNRLDAWILETRDLGLMPEAEMHLRAEDEVFHRLGQDPRAYPLERILDTANLALRGPGALPELCARLRDGAHPAVRYWAALGIVALEAGDDESIAALTGALEDASPTAKLGAAEALTHLGHVPEAVEAALAALMAHGEGFVRLHAANLLDLHATRSEAARTVLRAHVDDEHEYVRRVARYAAGVPIFD